MNKTRAVMLAAAALAALPMSSRAQAYAVDRGSYILQGSAGWSSSRFTTEIAGATVHQRSTDVVLTPAVQYFVRPGLALGGQVNVLHSASGGNSSTAYGIGPKATYYFGRGERTYYPYISAGATYVRETFSHANAVGGDGSAGAVFMLTRSVALDGSLYYRHLQNNGDDVKQRINNFGLGIGVTAFAF
ncbi:MAG TPA: outer membrane beta-barrel protein [Longimicrobiaceae bacterium]|jgi:hypothetical protein|nr:outer membrane beta-barrel protein [Longimicrobiaceae bacterium]